MREFALDLAMRAGELLLDYQRRGLARPLRSKSSHMDVVTEADLAAEQLITAAIQERYPGHAIFAEESASAPGATLPDAEWVWYIDPVDGTTNYTHGLPMFAVNIGVAHQRVPVLGITHAPAMNCTYWGEKGEGAWLRHDGGLRRLRVSGIPALEQALLATGFPYDRGTSSDNNLAEFASLDLRAQAVRRLGTAALEMAWVAEGSLDGYWENRAHAWDWLAGTVLVREAGGMVTNFAGRAWEPGMRQMLASNGQAGIHAQMQAAITTARE
jgi:myo-inositol-1(or 4)-monophosphatase